MTIEIRDMVSREVHYCVSHLISELARDEHHMDELMQVCIQDDWEEPQSDYVSKMDRSELVEYLEHHQGTACFDDEPTSDLRKAVLDVEAQEFCDHIGLDPHTNEAYEHWIVSDWLADKLEAHGEMVIRDFMGLTIWGRTCSGQAIACDWVIQQIYSEMMKD